MSDTEERIGTSWFHAGGPPDEGEPASDKQKRFVLMLADQMDQHLTREEKAMIEIEGGFEVWAAGLTKVQATSYISRVMSQVRDAENQLKRKEEALQKEAKAAGVEGENLLGKCVCGGFLIMDGPGSYSCSHCQSRGFRCRRNK